MSLDRHAFRLLPSEEVLWHGRPVAGVSRDRRYRVIPAFLFCLALVFAAFGGLLWVTGLEAPRQTLSLAGLLALLGVAVLLAPRYLHDPCEYLVTDKRVIWRRGRMKRWIDLKGIHFARITWHRNAPGVGHLELVRAVPFGPLARRQRLMLHDVRAPDTVYALIRGAEPSEHTGDNGVSLIDRLDPNEQILWGGHPEGWLLGWRDLAVAAIGAFVIVIGLRYGHGAASILTGLEGVGLSTQSLTWAFFFTAVAITWAVILTVGVGLFWHGLFRSRALGRETEYVLTDRRLLIRRGRTELSVDRRRIVDVADTRTYRGLHHLFLVLDAPESRALADSGALGTLVPARDAVPPILYELRDVEALKRLILDEPERDSLPPVRDAA